MMRFFLIFLFLSLQACAPVTKNLHSKQRAIKSIRRGIIESDRNLSEKGEEIGEDPSSIPIEVNKRVAYWIEYFTVTDRERIIRYFKRGSALKKRIEEILIKNEVPKELFYLAMIESGFVLDARSKANAVGIWQMIKGTARNYGLAVNSHTDERKHWIKSSFAAINYLKDLRNVFGSWYLAFAAYNAGEYRIVRSIMKGKSRDFWVLAEGKILPRETLNYVPKILAMLIIAKHPEQYGITYEKEKEWEEYEVVKSPSGLKLGEISQTANIPLKVLKKWNRDLKKNKVPYTKTGVYEIYIPKKYSAKLALIENLKTKKLLRVSDKKYNLEYPAYIKNQYRIYIVKNKDNLSKIAKTLNVSIRSLKKLNGIRRSTIYPGQRLRYYNVKNEEKNTVTIEKKKTPKYTKTNTIAREKSRINIRNYHEVKSGDSIYSIAKRYKNSVNFLLKINNMKNYSIYPGQKIFLSRKEEELKELLSKPLRKPTASHSFHEIKKGDSLYSLAKRYNVSIDELVKINNLKNYTIYPGQKIFLSRKEEELKELASKLLRKPTASQSFHEIKKGDSLYSLAKRYNVSIDELVKINNLKNYTIYPGQKIFLKE